LTVIRDGLKRDVEIEIQVGDPLLIRDSSSGVVELVSVEGNAKMPINPIEYYSILSTVGIGITQAAAKLHVVGIISVS
jgi:hypothetical protein